ncbi:AraC family transcriptional regulator [Tropicimonas sp. IMCC34043]|uniref:AraC family transcriptional regulator n=1 Tax=Tropicimonas sp. IMCC34043 TaxID=2248760 RepID=UPI0018E56BA2|nr:AraC family transcriptional regulator [Tropicimonas sp. IMCC34043]
MLKKNGGVPLARLRGIGSLPEEIEAAAGERGLIRSFQVAGLPLEVLQNRNLPIPLSLMMSLFEAGAVTVGDRALGLTVGKRMSYQVYGHWADYSERAPDLGSALRRACATVKSQLTGVDMTFRREAGLWIWRCSPPLFRKSSVQYVDHIIFPMMAFAQIYLGTGWRPDWIEVSYARDKAAQLIEAALQAPLRCGGEGIAFPFSAEDVARSHPSAARATAERFELKEVVNDVVLSDAPEPARSLSAVVSLRLLQGESDIEGAAALAGVSIQGLQRRLRTSGYTYRDIVEAARRMRAVTLLRETNLSVSAIAFSLGYEEHANFSRAFQRWFDCSPSMYRESQRHPPAT